MSRALASEAERGLHCPHCAPLRYPQACPLQRQSVTLQCPLCARSWPLLDVPGGPLAVLVPDPTAALQMAACVRSILDNPRLIDHALDAQDDLQRALAGGLLHYAQAHYGRYCAPPLPAADLTWLHGWLPQSLPAGDVAVLGCGPGGEWLPLRAELAVADRTVWLCDANLAALAWGQWLANAGRLALPWRASATRVAWTEAALDDAAQTALRGVQWLCADALQPPWQAARMAAVVTIGLLDSVSDPLALIQQVEALLVPGGVWLLATPWNWQEHVTPRNRQLERFVSDVDLPHGYAKLLTGQTIPGLGGQLRILRRDPDVAWRLPGHGRFSLDYRLDVYLLEKTAV